MRSMQSRGIIPIRAKNPVCGIIKGIDISIANNAISPQINIFSFFMTSNQLYCKDMKKFIYLCSFV